MAVMDNVLPMETVPVEPNGVYLPQVIFQTAIINGLPVTSCQIALAAVRKDPVTLICVPTGQSGFAYLPDVDNLDPDIASAQAVVTDLYAKLVQLVTALNNRREIL